MRARHRHFNARHLDNIRAVFDARRITGLANNDPVTTWADGSGNGHDITQGTAANRPLWLAAGVNGQPAVDFDGTNDSLAVASQVPTTENQGAGLLLFKSDVAPYGGAGAGRFFNISHNGTDNRLYAGAGGDYSNSARIGGASGPPPKSAFDFQSTANLSTNWTFLMIQRAVGADARMFIGNVQNGSTLTPPNTTATSHNIILGGDVNGYFNGQAAAFIVLRNPPTASMRNRLHHALAFSFKIACN